MGITDDQKYLTLPASDDQVAQNLKGAAHDSYWAQTVGRNVAYLAANKTLTTVISSYSVDWDNNTSNDYTGPRGRAEVWAPHTNFTFICKARKKFGDGTITVRVSGQYPDVDQLIGTSGVHVPYHEETITVTTATHDEYSATFTVVPPPNRIVYITTRYNHCDIVFAMCYATVSDLGGS